jgi:S1-C subfamily serine protease
MTTVNMNDKFVFRKWILSFLLSVSIALIIGLSNVYAQVSSQATNTPAPTLTPLPSLTPTLSVEQKVAVVETQITQINEKLETPKKDIWDILTSISGLLSSVIIAGIGLWATHVYNQRQLANEKSQKEKELSVMQVQTVQTFMPYLQSENPREVNTALLAISALGNSTLASDLAKLNSNTEGAIEALSKIALSQNKLEALYAENVLAELFQSLQKSVVWIETQHRGTSGFIVNSHGYVINTNPDLADYKDASISITCQNNIYNASLFFHDKDTMLNLFRIENEVADSGLLPSLPLADDDDIKPKDEVFILGYRARIDKWKFNIGKVIETNIKLEQHPFLTFIRSEIETDIGYSGAPLVNKKGQVVGIHVMRDPLHGQDSLTKLSISAKDIRRIISEINSP